MTPIDNPALQNLHQRTKAMLTAIDDAPLERIDHGHYQHYYEELRLLVEEWQSGTGLQQVARPAAPRQRIWLVWDCCDVVAAVDTEHDAQEARADLQHQLLCEYGPNLELIESITITTAHVQTARPAPARMRP